MSISSQPKGDIDVLITVADGSVTPLTLTLPFRLGSEVLDNLAEILNEKHIVEARGRRVGVAYGNRIYPTLTVEGLATQFTAAAEPGTFADWFLHRGVYQSAVSTLGANKPWAFHLTINVEGTDWGDAADSEVTLEDMIVDKFSWGAAVGGQNKFTATLRCTGDVTGDLGCSEI